MRVRSADGTPLAVHPQGAGPDILLVHGSAADHHDWDAVVPHLAGFRTLAMDRRGRGASGDGPRHSIEAEAEDVAACCRALGAPSVFAHSYGAIVALEAARLGAPMRSLVLYEPPIWIEPIEDDLSPRLEKLTAAGDRDATLATFLREAAGMTDEEIAMMRGDEAVWGAGIASAPTLAREVKTDFAFRFDPARYGTLKVPILLALGSESPAFFGEAARAVVAAVPGATLVTLEGQAHAAMMLAPELLVGKVRPFLSQV